MSEKRFNINGNIHALAPNVSVLVYMLDAFAFCFTTTKFSILLLL